jgi:hypothetical protein
LKDNIKMDLNLLEWDSMDCNYVVNVRDLWLNVVIISNLVQLLLEFQFALRSSYCR